MKQLAKESPKEEREIILQSLRVERVAVFFRIMASLSGFFIVTLLRASIEPRVVVSAYIGCAAIAIEALIIALIVYRKKINRKQIRIMQYLSSTFEVLVVTVMIWLFGEYQIFKSPNYQAYFVFISLAAFRYSRVLTLYTGLLSTFFYVALFIYSIATNAIVIGTLAEEYLDPVVSIIGIVVKVTFMVLVSVLLSLTAKGYGRVINIARIEAREVERERNRSLKLRRYFTKNVAEYIIKSGDNLAGEKKEVSVLFCDFRNFSRLSKTMSSEQVFTTLNHYLTKMADIVFEHGGTLDKYTGDGFMAVFGAPLQKGDDAFNAVRTAIKIKKEIAAISQTSKTDIGQDIQIGIGISTGEAVAGNVGSKERMDYTVIGSVVNLASRIERLNRQLGTTVLISEYTYEKIRNAVNANRLGRYRIRGLEKPVIIYEMLDVINDTDAA